MHHSILCVVRDSLPCSLLVSKVGAGLIALVWDVVEAIGGVVGESETRNAFAGALNDADGRWGGGIVLSNGGGGIKWVMLVVVMVVEAAGVVHDHQGWWCS